MNDKCQVAGCNEIPEKEVHLLFPKQSPNIFVLCKEHFCVCEAEWKRANQPREIFDIENPDSKEVVEFT